jgi:hypothetical protein
VIGIERLCAKFNDLNTNDEEEEKEAKHVPGFNPDRVNSFFFDVYGKVHKVKF